MEGIQTLVKKKKRRSHLINPTSSVIAVKNLAILHMNVMLESISSNTKGK